MAPPQKSQANNFCSQACNGLLFFGIYKIILASGTSPSDLDYLRLNNYDCYRYINTQVWFYLWYGIACIVLSGATKVKEEISAIGLLLMLGACLF